jgi:hypothetical protein
MEKYDPEHGSRANLNMISAAMAMEVKEGRGPIYLDFSRYTRSLSNSLNESSLSSISLSSVPASSGEIGSFQNWNGFL